MEKQFIMAKDIIHEPVKKAIEKAGWTITDDQYTVDYAEFTVYADLAARCTKLFWTKLSQSGNCILPLVRKPTMTHFGWKLYNCS